MVAGAESTQFVLSAGGATMTIEQRGARITSLVSAHGRQWLSQPPSTPRTAEPRGVPFLDRGVSGWDECFPTVDECTLEGVRLGDHGEVWNVDWNLDHADAESVELSVHVPVFAMTFSRRISVRANAFSFEYTVTAENSRVPFLWVAHPQFVSPPGTTVELAGGDPRFVEAGRFPVMTLIEHGPVFSIDALQVGSSQKLWALPDTPITGATIKHADGGELTMRWNQGVPYFALWFDNACFSNEAVIALEPASGHGDSLAVVVQTGRVRQAQPLTPARWRMELSLS